MRVNPVAISLAFAMLSFASVLAEATPIDVKKTNGCGCCLGWMKHLEDNGFAPTGGDMFGGLLVRLKPDNSVPQRMVSCHATFVDGDVIEGHVPAIDIRRPLEERPVAVGLAVPGMPYGSPGMGPEDDREAYDMVLTNDDGSTAVFAKYPST